MRALFECVYAPSHLAPTPMSFPDLPYDVIEHILTQTAASSPSAALTLCLVASWVRNIAIPQLLQTVVLDSYSKHIAFLQNRRLANPQASYGSAEAVTIPLGHHVRNLLVDSNGADMHPMYMLCPYLETLAIPAARLIAFSTSTPHLFSRLRTLIVLTSGPSSVSEALWANLTRVQPYACLTHLHFLDLPTNPLPFEGMPRLSHLALPLTTSDNTTPAEFDGFLQRCAGLKMLVLTMPSQPDAVSVSMFRTHDARMYLCFRPAHSAAGWRSEVDGGMSIWDRAVQVRSSFPDSLPRGPVHI
ncbi:hypothetical protein C8R43DRAFT_658655 [Mycena crocata]|nr:hypothetical protein C8R43DRAFT_658655 [Mycena crocata]